MEGSCKKNFSCRWPSGPFSRSPGRVWFQVMLLVVVFTIFRSDVLASEGSRTMAVLPFRVHALQPLDHLKRGLQEMLTNRMEKMGFHMVSPEEVNKDPLAFLPTFEIKDVVRLGKDLEAGWIISGSLTQIGEKASIDLNVIDVTEKRPPFLVFMVADNIDALADTVKLITVSIENKITGLAQVDSVHVRGSQRIEKEAILAVIKTHKGDRFDYDQLDKDLRNIYKMGFFKDVSIETEDGPMGKIVVFNVIEKPSIAKIVFAGNKKVDDDDLKKELGIKLYSILDQNEIRQSIERLKEYYRQKAFYNADIKYRLEPLSNNQILLKYEIAEHDKVYVTEIKFLGNTRFDDDDLKDIMETSEMGFFSWLSWLTDRGHLDKKKLEFDVHKIAAFYHNHGFIKARVGEPKIKFEKEKGLTIAIEIAEGHQYGVNKVGIEGDLIKPADELLEKVQIGKEEVFNREIVRKDIMALRSVYVDEGYAYAEVSPRTRDDDETHLVDITYRISKGPKVRFERINISGNAVTRDKVIRRELKVVEGGDFSGKALRRSTENLHRLGFFEDMEMQTKKGSREDLMVLDIRVKERPTGNFSIGAGYSSQDAVFGTFQVSQNNLFGYGQKLRAAAKIGGKSSEFDISFIEPWFLDRPVSVGVDAYKWKYEYDAYDRDSTGGAVSCGFLLGIDDFTRGSVEYRYDSARITEIDEANASVAIKEMEGRNVTSSMTVGIKRDTRDRSWNTSKGSINSISFQYAGGILGGDQYFNKYRARTAWYFPLFWKTVFMAQGRLGYIVKRSGGELFVYQKFMIGGMSTVRGFDYASISPVDPKTGDKIGGEKEMIFNLEYTFPLFEEHGLAGVVFFDAGNVFASDESFSFSGIRRSAGAGIRWYSPIGPLRLEYGKNLDRRGGESTGKWEFSVGGLF